MKTLLFLVVVAAALWWAWDYHQEKEKSRVQAEILVAQKAEMERAQQPVEAKKGSEPVGAGRLGIKQTGALQMEKNVKTSGSGSGPAASTPAPQSALDRKAYR